jgi:hypothetical protein
MAEGREGENSKAQDSPDLEVDRCRVQSVLGSVRCRVRSGKRFSRAALNSGPGGVEVMLLGSHRRL